MNEKKLITIVGPTASGKTGRAVALAEALGGEIISGDSRQVYRGMDLGTGKDLEEYGEVPYHLIDICDAGEKYNLHRFISDFSRVYDDIKRRGVQPILCGGTGMYVETAISGIRLPEVPENTELRNSLATKSLKELEEILRGYKTLHNTTDIDTAKRAIRAIEIEDYYSKNPMAALMADRGRATPLETVIIGVDISREKRRRRISMRLDKRLDEGMVDEIRSLLKDGVKPEDLIYYGLEYKFLTLYVIGSLSYDEMRRQLEIAIHQFAKRQMTWFRGMERRGFKIHWLPYDLPKDVFLASVMDILAQ
ncbi:MAG: tRNA (adenosine(37)-N6)-dimethylallyltransferase MiaA [Muribaculaceae bacterium]|nr:tRNA (adenosine(37)-N6)-dimethylallyltransferase MiaA [Muribaculaceae bacterium]